MIVASSTASGAISRYFFHNKMFVIKTHKCSRGQMAVAKLSSISYFWSGLEIWRRCMYLSEFLAFLRVHHHRSARNLDRYPLSTSRVWRNSFNSLIIDRRNLGLLVGDPCQWFLLEVWVRCCYQRHFPLYKHHEWNQTNREANFHKRSIYFK